jgi:hypothetical protein
MLLENYVDPDELDEFLRLAAAAADEDENGVDVEEELRDLGFLAMTGDPAGYPEPLRSAATTLRQYLVAHNEVIEHHPWAYADDVAEMFKDAVGRTSSVLGEDCQIGKIAEYRARPRACRALAARAKFGAQKPIGAPDLPISREAIETLQRAPDCVSMLVGHFANSLRRIGWSMRHPAWNPYCAGLAAMPHVVDLVRRAGLNVPPRLLRGLDPATLCWEP